MSATRFGERDAALVGWLARTKVATIAQIRERFALGQSRAYERLGALRQAGLLDYARPLRSGGAYYATGRGLRAVGRTELSVARVSLGSITHDLAATGALARLELSAPGLEILTERELRAHDHGNPRPRYRLTVRDPHRGRDVTHRPDLAICAGEEWIAVEIELTSKGPVRTDRILRAYHTRSSNKVAGLLGVIYLLPTPRDLERVTERAAGNGIRSGIAAALIDAPDALAPLRALRAQLAR